MVPAVNEKASLQLSAVPESIVPDYYRRKFDSLLRESVVRSLRP